MPTSGELVQTATPAASEPQVSLAPAQPIPSPSSASLTSEEQPALSIRNASPEFDQTALSKKLAVPAALLVLLALFALLVFEGRLRRMAHAAAVRKAGPRPIAEITGYPVPPGYGPAVVSYVPVPAYPVPPYGYGYPPPYAQPYPPPGYPPQAYQAPGYPPPGYPPQPPQFEPPPFEPPPYAYPQAEVIETHPPAPDPWGHAGRDEGPGQNPALEPGPDEEHGPSGTRIWPTQGG